jgi:hypothetical protein
MSDAVWRTLRQCGDEFRASESVQETSELPTKKSSCEVRTPNCRLLQATQPLAPPLTDQEVVLIR